MCLYLLKAVTECCNIVSAEQSCLVQFILSDIGTVIFAFIFSKVVESSKKTVQYHPISHHPSYPAHWTDTEKVEVVLKHCKPLIG